MTNISILKKMNRILVILIALAFGFSCKTPLKVTRPFESDESIIQIKALYNGFGKVFRTHNEANRDFFGNAYSSPIFPFFARDLELTNEMILKTEEIFVSNYNRTVVERYGERARVLSDPKSFYGNYYRQYFGFVHLNGEEMVFLVLMNFEDKKRARKSFGGWDQNIARGAGEFFEKNERSFLVNLTKESLSVY